MEGQRNRCWNLQTSKIIEMGMEQTFRNHTKKEQTIVAGMPLKGWFKHQVREALRQTALSKPHNRKDIAGIENGVEYEHTVALLRSEELSEEDQGIFRDILQGRAATKARTSHSLLGAAVER